MDRDGRFRRQMKRLREKWDKKWAKEEKLLALGRTNRSAKKEK